MEVGYGRWACFRWFSGCDECNPTIDFDAAWKFDASRNSAILTTWERCAFFNAFRNKRSVVEGSKTCQDRPEQVTSDYLNGSGQTIGPTAGPAPR